MAAVLPQNLAELVRGAVVACGAMAIPRYVLGRLLADAPNLAVAPGLMPTHRLCGRATGLIWCWVKGSGRALSGWVGSPVTPHQKFCAAAAPRSRRAVRMPATAPALPLADQPPPEPKSTRPTNPAWRSESRPTASRSLRPQISGVLPSNPRTNPGRPEQVGLQHGDEGTRRGKVKSEWQSAPHHFEIIPIDAGDEGERGENAGHNRERFSITEFHAMPAGDVGSETGIALVARSSVFSKTKRNICSNPQNPGGPSPSTLVSGAARIRI